MRTMIATTVLTLVFLWAGPIVGSGLSKPGGPKLHHANVTVVAKNQAWPVKRQVFQSCAVTRCIDI